jgi:hypothetical protein
MKGTWIQFDLQGHSKSGKTYVWSVVPTDGGSRIGEIFWYPAWRKYCFFPYRDTVFEQTCLRDIADFCEQATKEHKAKNTTGAAT